MKSLRHIVLLVLLLTVPFQAAVGAGGMLCTALMQMSGADMGATALDPAEAPLPGEGHHSSMSHLGHHAQMTKADHQASLADGHPSAVAQEDGQDGSDASGKCKTCNECSSPAVPVPPATASVFPPDTPLRVSSLVNPDLVSRTGDGLFRPPRSSSV